MISEKMAKALNNHLNKEFYSAYLYLAMAAYFDEQGLTGFSHWMKAQSNEEYQHALEFYNYIDSVGARVVLEAIEKPKTEWNSSLEVFQDALEHELLVTKLINDLAALAKEENDFATANFINLFVNEQVEEVANVKAIVEKFKLIGEDKGGLFMLDHELGSRQKAE